MPETAETATTPDPDTSTEHPEEAATADLAAEVEKWKGLARKNEERAKANAGAARELEQLRQQAMTDQERAVADARAAGRAEAMAEAAADIVRSRIEAAAAGRFQPDQLAVLTGGINPSKFLTDEGQVDTDAVKAFIEGIAPQPSEQPSGPPPPLDLGQGVRSGMALNGDPLLDSLKRAVGAK